MAIRPYRHLLSVRPSKPSRPPALRVPPRRLARYRLIGNQTVRSESSEREREERERERERERDYPRADLRFHKIPKDAEKLAFFGGICVEVNVK